MLTDKEVLTFLMLNGIEVITAVSLQNMSRLLGAQFQCPPLISAVKRQLRVRRIKTIDLVEYDNKSDLGE